MALQTCVVIRHVAFEDLGCWEAELPRLGYEVRYLEAGVDDLSPFRTADLGIVLGGPIGVEDAADYPTVTKEIALIKDRLDADQPTLGVCLGLQLMAAALGARVGKGTFELGWKHIRPTSVGLVGPLRRVASAPMFVWHGDEAELPSGAVLLASTDEVPVHAFSYGRSLAVQFHPEVDPATFERWVIGNMVELREIGVSVPEFRAEMQERGPAAVYASLRLLRDFIAGL
ncbi:glutamine amidotransferase-related protein [Demequina capsici]|uniref:Gamma-glutamyl-gamma-aminobutyrate hydrolase family protein n=1 Tax=Demequina capsici TaxID=3075620 RepID=A0AA96J7F9_9MICO|nr:gamma-glutamyl-gamma-aminobutyrate hydrolase family protein [Demequina sp. OYTSA14]WNM23998.1 gamma-glutamyl-gamma-aminobutyrate hydrolase family protein [Demequina sp. OYTSA14]